MRTLRILITIFLFQGAFAAAEPFRSFLRQASTTRRSGPVPQAEEPQPSGVLGVPGARPAGQSQVPSGQPSEQPARRPRTNLEELLRGKRGLNPKLRERLRQMSGESGHQEAGTPAPEPAVQPRSEAAIKQGGTGVTLTFKNASIDEVVEVIMKELGHSYILDPQVAGTVNLFTHREFPKDKLFGVLEQLLKMSGQAIIRQDDLYVILPLGQSATIPGPILKRPVSPPAEAESEPAQGRPQPPGQQPPSPPPGAGPGNPAAAAIAQQPETPQPTTITIPEQPSESEQLQGEEGVITYIVPLHYIPSADMVTMIKAFVSDGAQVVDFQSANILIITDYRANIKQALEIIRLLDTEYFDVNTVDLVPVRYHQAVDVAEDLAQIFAPGEKAGGVRIVAIERLNSILVVTHAPEVFAKVVGWIDRLDAPSGGTSIRTFIYEVQNSTAANIAEILSQLYADGAGLPSGGGTAEEQEESQQQARQRRERQREEAAFLPESQGRLGGGGLPLGPTLGGRAASSGVRAAVVTGDVKVIVNEFNNSLIIQGTEADYQFLRQTIELLDILPRQVLIEAKIYAVELRNDLSYGLSWFLQDRLEDLGHPTTGSITRVGEEGGGGISATTRIFIGSARQLDIVVDALRTRTNVELLEAPTLLVVDGTEAQINVGAEVPVTTASFGDPLRSGSSTSFVNSISFRPTGTTLLIMPRISASGIVNMDLAIEVSSATGPALTPTINRNFVRTSMIVRDGQQVGIAGIISDSYDVSSDRVPILGDIPYFGALFGQTTKNRRRFELLFLITPHVIRNLPTVAELTLEFKRGLVNAYGFIERKEMEDRELKERRRQEEKSKTETNK